MSEQTSNPTSGQNVPKSRKSKFRQKSQQQKTAESKLRMERRGEKLDAARKKLAKQKPLKTKGPVRRVAGVAGRGVHGFVHGKIYEVEHENVGTEGAHRTELAGETVLRHGTRFVKKQIREHPARAVRRAESRHTKATADYYYRKTVEEHPEMQKGGALSRYLQKQKIKRQYAKQVREAAKQGGKTAEKAVSSAGKLTEKVVAYAKEHPVGLLAAALCLILLLSLQSCLSSMTTVGNGLVGAVAASTYPSEDADMLGAEAAYCAMEDELQDYLDSYQRTHDYDEYHFDLDDIEHDPYVLISILTALREGAWEGRPLPPPPSAGPPDRPGAVRWQKRSSKIRSVPSVLPSCLCCLGWHLQWKTCAVIFRPGLFPHSSRYPKLRIRFTLSRQFSFTFTQVWRYTLVPMNRSMSCRAREDTFFSMAPPLPMMIPLWLFFSQ